MADYLLKEGYTATERLVIEGGSAGGLLIGAVLNLRPSPAMLVRTSRNHSQVMYWEPAKWMARLRSRNAGATSALFKINLDAGDGGASGRYDYLREIAFDYAWVLREPVHS